MGDAIEYLAGQMGRTTDDVATGIKNYFISKGVSHSFLLTSDVEVISIDTNKFRLITSSLSLEISTQTFRGLDQETRQIVEKTRVIARRIGRELTVDKKPGNNKTGYRLPASGGSRRI